MWAKVSFEGIKIFLTRKEIKNKYNKNCKKKKNIDFKGESDADIDIDGAVQCGVEHCSIVHYIAVQCRAEQCNIVQCIVAYAV